MIARRALALLPLAAPAAAQGVAFLETGAAVALLRAGGLNLYIRHAIAERDGAARHLSAAGEEQAIRLGGAFDALDIPVAEVLAGEAPRTRATAELAFGPARLRLASELTAPERPGQPAPDAGALLRRLGEPVAGGNRVLVGDLLPLGLALGRRLAEEALPEGAIALFRPLGARGEPLGVLRAEPLIAAARLP